MLDWFPFRSACRIVGNGHSQGKRIRQLGLDLGFPGMTAATVAATGIGQNEQLAGTAIAGRTFLMPPMSNGMRRRRRRYRGKRRPPGRRDSP